MNIHSTPRLMLRRFTPEDAPLIFELNSDPLVLKYLGEKTLQHIEEARSIIENIIMPQYQMNLGRLAMFTLSGNEFIGWCGLKYRSELDEIDLGYRLKVNAWGKGYATEAAQYCMHYGFEKMKLNRIVGRAHVDNIGSQNVLLKCGMHYLRNECIDGEPLKTYEAIVAEVK